MRCLQSSERSVTFLTVVTQLLDHKGRRALASQWWCLVAQQSIQVSLRQAILTVASLYARSLLLLLLLRDKVILLSFAPILLDHYFQDLVEYSTLAYIRILPSPCTSPTEFVPCWLRMTSCCSLLDVAEHKAWCLTKKTGSGHNLHMLCCCR